MMHTRKHGRLVARNVATQIVLNIKPEISETKDMVYVYGIWYPGTRIYGMQCDPHMHM